MGLINKWEADIYRSFVNLNGISLNLVELGKENLQIKFQSIWIELINSSDYFLASLEQLAGQKDIALI